MANLKISQLPVAAIPTVNDLLAVVNSGTTSQITVQDIINLTPDVGFTGNTSGTCITDIFVTNLNSCSPLNIFADGIKMGEFTQASGFKLESGVNFVIPTGSEIVDGGGSPLVSEGSSSNRVSADGVEAIASDYWGGDIYRTSISGTSSGSTATTRYETAYQIGDNLKTESRWAIPVGSSPYITYQRSQGDKKLDANGMFYQMAGGSDNLNREGTVCFCAGRPSAYGSACMGRCPLQLFESLKVESYINDSNNAALYTVNAVNVDDDAIGTSFLHSNYSTALVNQTIFDTIRIYDNKLIIGDGSDIKNEKFYNTDSLVISESISGSTTGMTETTYIRKYDLGEGIDFYTSRKQEMTKDNVYQYSTGYKTSSNSFSDFTINTLNSDWLTSLEANCVIAPVCDGSAVNIKSAVIEDDDPANSIANYIIEGFNPLAKVNYKVQGVDNSSNLLVDYININTGASVKSFGNLGHHMYYNHRQDISEAGGSNNLIDKVTYSGVSTGYTGTTVVFKEERDLIAGTKTTIINDVNKVVLSDLLLTSYVTIKSNNGNFNFGSLTGEIPSSPTDGMGDIGDVRIGGNNIYVKLANGKWGISTLSEAW